MFWTKKTPLNYVPKRIIDALSSQFNDHELTELVTLGTLVELDAGTKLTVEGTTGREALVIVSGTASVLRDGETVATVGAGDVVGEIALLSGEPRMANVVADTEMAAYVLSPSEFSTLLARCPRLERKVSTTAVKRLATA